MAPVIELEHISYPGGEEVRHKETILNAPDVNGVYQTSYGPISIEINRKENPSITLEADFLSGRERWLGNSHQDKGPTQREIQLSKKKLTGSQKIDAVTSIRVALQK